VLHLAATLSAQLNAAISNRKLDMVGEAIRDNAAECYALVVDSREDYASVGNTRFGGDPDLPIDAQWPIDSDGEHKRHSNFVAQINFADLPHLATNNALPITGILYIFVRYMGSASEAVLLDTIFYEGDASKLRRRPSPSEDQLCDEYLVDLVPQKIKSVPAVSIAHYRKAFRSHVEQHSPEIDGEEGGIRRMYLDSDLRESGQIGQLLGFANAGDERENLYREVVLDRLGKRALIYNDYWDSMEEYEAYILQWSNNSQLVSTYEKMRSGVMWLTSNRDLIAKSVDEWRLLFRIDSNRQMNLNINDADPLYVFIRHEDLANRNFSNLAGEITQG
jgi:uncharacterized protein YwqG